MVVPYEDAGVVSADALGEVNRDAAGPVHGVSRGKGGRCTAVA